MKMFTRFTLFGISILIVLLALSSCMKPLPILTVTTDPTSIHPPGGVIIEAVCSQEGGTYTLSVEGDDPIESTEGVFAVTVDDWPWHAAVVWTDGDSVAESAVKLTLKNERPMAHALTLSPASLLTGQGVWIDLRYLMQGCINGTPQRISGIEDPDYTADGYSIENDGFTYHVEIFDKDTGKQETIYKPDRTVLGHDEYTISPYFKWFVDRKEETPPFPFSSMSEGQAIKLIHVYVKEWGNAYHWVYEVSAGVAGCSIKVEEEK